jgi:hypothetical protein
MSLKAPPTANRMVPEEGNHRRTGFLAIGLPGGFCRKASKEQAHDDQEEAFRRPGARQLKVYGHDGLPVLSADGHQIPGWVTAPDALRAVSAPAGNGH